MKIITFRSVNVAHQSTEVMQVDAMSVIAAKQKPECVLCRFASM